MLNKITTVLALLVIIQSCNRESIREESPGDGQVGIKASIAATSTKTWLDSEGAGPVLKVYWSDGDRINVNGQNSAPLSIADEKVSDAEFKLRSVIAPYNIIYPAEVVANSHYDSEGNIQIAIPTTQQYNPTSFANGSAILYGWSDNADAQVSLVNLCAAVRVQLKGEASTEIERAVMSSDSTPLAGTFWLNPQSGLLTSEEGQTSVELVFDQAIALSESGSWFYFTLPAGEYPDGLAFNFTQASDKRFMQCKWTPTSALQAGTLYTFSNVDYLPGAKDIENPDDWNEFAATLNAGEDMSKWLRNGTVYLGCDISAEDLQQVTVDFEYAFDGQGHTITRTAGTGALFRSVSGSIANLTLAGEITSTATTCSALADLLLAGGTINSCVNNAKVSVQAETYARTAGLVGIMNGGTISNCTNNGSIYASVDCSEGDVLNLQAAGIVAQIDVTPEGASDALLVNCTNAGEILADPVYTLANKDYGIKIAGAGGIVAWLRGTSHSFTFDNCDNSGTVTYSGDHIVSTNGTYAYAVSVGGIVGIAGDLSVTYGVYNTDIGSNGLDVTMTGCDNTGTVHNCGINYSATGASNNKVYTGGIAGSLVGTSEKKASLTNCSNTGYLYTYDRTGTGTSTRPVYCQVVGGLIGYGGYVTIDGCLVNGTIGNGKRASNAIAGAIGFAMRPFDIINSTVWYTGYFVRLNGSNQTNSATMAVVTKSFGTKVLAPAPSVEGSSIKNCSGGALLYYYNVASATSVTDDSGNCTSSTKLTAADIGSAFNIVRGYGYTEANVTRSEITFENNTTLNDAP